MFTVLKAITMLQKKNRSKRQTQLHIIVVFLVLFCCVGCDQATKAAARKYLPRNEALSFAGDTLRLQYAENKGAF